MRILAADRRSEGAFRNVLLGFLSMLALLLIGKGV
jgi:hypothetical protein